MKKAKKIAKKIDQINEMVESLKRLLLTTLNLIVIIKVIIMMVT